MKKTVAIPRKPKVKAEGVIRMTKPHFNQPSFFSQLNKYMPNLRKYTKQRNVNIAVGSLIVGGILAGTGLFLAKQLKNKPKSRMDELKTGLGNLLCSLSKNARALIKR